MAEEISPSADADYRTHLFRRHQFAALLLTFAAYTSYHASRKPLSIVKSVLGPDPSHLTFSGWPPFNGPRGPHRLGELDLAFLSSYAAGMYFAGHVGDRIDLRRFLAFGMIGSGIFTVALGMGYWLEIHSLGFFLAVQVVCGAFQSIGWPCVVAVMGNWYGKEGRGLVMGLWSSNASVGNILGSFVASAVLEYGWGWSFVVPAAIVVMVAVLVLGFLVASPQDLGFGGGEVEIEMAEGGRVNEKGVDDSLDEAQVGLLGSRGSSNSKDLDTAIGFVEAWRLPGVAPYAACLFFSKLVAYTFLYWLPFYIRHTAVAGHHLSHKTAGILSTVFDIGGVFGGVCAGYVSDKMEARAVTSFVFLVISIPTLIAYRIFGSVSNSLNTFLMFFSGFFVNGPYALITTAVAADLGTQDLIKGNSRCLATVTAIIDGTGSVGAALGPLLTGYISTSGWNSVFLMLILAVSAASLFLVRLAKAEINKLNERK